MNAVDLVDDVAEQVAIVHSVDRAPKHGRDDVAPVATLGSAQRAQVRKESCALRAVGTAALLLIDERDQLVASDAVFLRGPILPAVRRLERGLELLAGELHFLLAYRLHVVEELEEHHPGQHGDAIEVAVEPLVLAHDVARGLED